jgi:AraC-like DNA-binding protein
MARAFGELRGTLITKKCAPYDTECARKRQQANIIAPMGEQTAAGIEGLEDRSITIYEQEDLVRTGVRGVDGDLGMAARVRAYGAVLVIGVSGTASEFERRPLRPGLPTIDIIFVQQGEFAYFEAGQWVASRGPLMVAPSGLPNRVRFNSEWQFVVARIPREALLPFVPMLSDTVQIHEELSVPEKAMAAFLAQSIDAEQEVSPNDSHTVDRMILQMAGTMLRARQGETLQPGSPHAVLRDRVMLDIAKQSGDSQLDPARLARNAGVSLRHLQCVFSEAGTSVAGEIRRERARIARSTLQDARYDELSIEQVAVQSGFGSSVSMRRALDEIYRLNPRDLRNGRS